MARIRAMGRVASSRFRLPAAARLLLALMVVAAPIMAAPALAHTLTRGPGGGVPIPSLVHGQMVVYQRHFADILRLAALAPAPAPEFSRVLNYARIQKAWCLWGLAPVAVTDEDSPFNECSHAYLAAGRLLIDELRERAAAGSEAVRLADTIDRELLLEGTPRLCGFSGEAFNTADHVVPRWAGVLGHGPSLAVVALGGSLLLGGAAAWRRRAPGPPRRA